MPVSQPRYRGIRYRSPLEAKWAAFFHHLRWDYVYDPLGDGTTSFLVCNPNPWRVLVTENAGDAEYHVECAVLRGEVERPTVVVGLTPFPRLRHSSEDWPLVGLLVGPAEAGTPVAWGCGEEDLCWVLGNVQHPFRGHGAVRAAWAKATNDIQAVA